MFRRLGIVALFLVCGCTPTHKPADPLALAHTPLSSDQAEKVLATLGENVAYGPGLGDAAVKVGTVVAFPPYALFLLSNAVLTLSGYEPMSVTAVLPKDMATEVGAAYDGFVSVPGQMTAAMAGHEFRTKESGDARIEKIITRSPSAPLY